MSRFPYEYGDHNAAVGRGGCQWFFPPMGYDWYRENQQISRFCFAVLTCVPKANIVDGESVSVRFNTNQLGVPSSGFGLGRPEITYVFEFDTVPDGVHPNNIAVDISGDTTAADVRQTLISVMLATFTGTPLKAIAAGTAGIRVQTPIFWADLEVTDDVADAGFTVSDVRPITRRPVRFGPGPLRGWHRFDLQPNQPLELPVQIGMPIP